MEYDSPEAIEQTIKVRCNDFSILAEIDNRKYYDLYNLAAESNH